MCSILLFISLAGFEVDPIDFRSGLIEFVKNTIVVTIVIGVCGSITSIY